MGKKLPVKKGTAGTRTGRAVADHSGAQFHCEVYMLELQIIGNAGQVRLHNTDSIKVLSISIASTRRAADDKSYTDWVQAKVWGDRAVALEPHVSKGQRLLVRGRPEASPYLSKDGQPAAGLVVHVRELEFVGSRPTAEEQYATSRKRTRKRSEKSAG